MTVKKVFLLAVMALVASSVFSVQAGADHSAFFTSGDTYRAYSSGRENTPTQADRFGVVGSWRDVNWDDLPCPQLDEGPSSPPEFQHFVISGLLYMGNSGDGGNTQIGYVKVKKRRASDNECITLHHYYWEWTRDNGDFDNGFISSPDPDHTTERTFKIARTNDSPPCASGSNWCIKFEIGSNVKHTCCGDGTYPALSSTDQQRVAVECVWHTSNYNCPVTGDYTDSNPLGELKYLQEVGGNWAFWDGTDEACNDNYENMRGKWKHAYAWRAGANVDYNGTSLSVNCSDNEDPLEPDIYP
jgi:hypothetical protein